MMGRATKRFRINAVEEQTTTFINSFEKKCKAKKTKQAIMERKYLSRGSKDG